MQAQSIIGRKPTIRYSQKSVLIIEDFAEFARALRSMMISIGSKQIDIVYNGEDAIQACKNRRYDIILSDYNLGNSKDGQQILEELHFHKLLKSNTTFVMVTAENTTAMVMGALEFQPDSYLTKPFNGSILKNRLDKAVYKKDLLGPIVLHMRKQEFREALSLCDEIAEANPKFKMACLRHKYNCFKALEMYDRALELTTRLITERPIPWAMLGAGEVFYAKGQLDRAADHFEDMIREFPMVLEGYDWLAKIHAKLNHPVEAQQTLAKAVELSPKALKRQKLLGSLAAENHDIEAMTKAYRQAVKCGNHSAFASPDEFIQLTRSLSMQLKEKSEQDRKRLISEAETTFGQLDKKFKAHPNTQFRSAVAHADFCAVIDDKDSVNKYLNTANKLYDKVEEHFTAKESLEIVNSLKQLGQDELSESILEEGVEQYFDNPEFIKQAAELTENQHLILNSKKVNQLNHQAIRYFKKNDVDQAINFFNQAHSIAPNNININLNLVQSLLKRAQTENKLDDLDQAEQILSTITRIGPADSRYPRYSELSRLTQLMIQKQQG